MSTRSNIAKLNEDGTVKSIYCHWDGYPSHNGKILQEHYRDEAKIDELLNLGSLSSLGEEIGIKHDFDTHTPGVCTAYLRDRGEPEENCKADVYESLEAFIKDFDDGKFEEYVYIWDGSWKVYPNSLFGSLEEELKEIELKEKRKNKA